MISKYKMEQFPDNFNDKSDFNELKNNLHLNGLRERIWRHYIENGDKDYFDLTKDISHKSNIDKIIQELNERGFKTKKIFNDTALLIYINEENVKIWINNYCL